MKTNKIMSNYQNFLAWLKSDCIFDGQYYSSQDAQYRNKLNKKEMYKYFKKEFIN
jgi:hypothetical protein